VTNDCGRFTPEYIAELQRDLREQRMGCGCRRWAGAHEPDCRVVRERMRRRDAGDADWAEYRE
jgi:hypothetical protein